MFFAKISRFLTACYLVLLCSGCVSTVTHTDFNRNEAVKARIHLALAYLDEQEFSKAKENIDRAIAHDSQDYLPYSVLAYYYQQLNDIEYAEKNYQIAIKLSQKQNRLAQPSPDVINNYGTFLCQQGKYQHAYAEFERALSQEQPYYHQADTLENIALCAKSEPDLERFEQAWQQLYTLDPERAKQLHEIAKYP